MPSGSCALRRCSLGCGPLGRGVVLAVYRRCLRYPAALCNDQFAAGERRGGGAWVCNAEAATRWTLKSFTEK